MIAAMTLAPLASTAAQQCQGSSSSSSRGRGSMILPLLLHPSLLMLLLLLGPFEPMGLTHGGGTSTATLRYPLLASAQLRLPGAEPSTLKFLSEHDTASAAARSAAVAAAVVSASRGPCSSSASAAVINVVKQSDFNKRTLFPPTRTVKLILKNNITLQNTGLLFEANFSCTWLMSSRGRFSLYLPMSSMPVIRVWNASNVIIMNVNIIGGVHGNSPYCKTVPENGPEGHFCPAVHIYKSYGIQLVKGYVQGRIDLYRSANCRVDSIKATAPGTFRQSNGVIRVGISGIGPKLIRSGIVISNNEVYGQDTPIVLYRGAVGVTVRNNLVYDYIFAGIRCGADVSYIGDCMLTTISNNYVRSSKRLTGDSAGIYFCTHWVNPGNVVSCNYVDGGDHCYYLDYVSSGIKILGGACFDTVDGVKLNNGKNNIIRSLLMIRTGLSDYTQCLTPTINNCRKYPGTYWEYARKTYYNSATINKLYPYLAPICTNTAINGVPCNPNVGKAALTAYQTGKCSGLPTENVVDVVLVDGVSPPPIYKYCRRMPTVPKMNTHSWVNISSSALQFNSVARKDYGVARSSQIYKARPGFVSCPRSRVGPKLQSIVTYVNAWNIPKPYFMDELKVMSDIHIHERPTRGPKPPGKPPSKK